MMKKIYTLLLFITVVAFNSVKAQVIYSNTVSSGYRYNPGLGENGTPFILMDDANIDNTVIADGDSIGITQIKVGIVRAASAPAVTVTVYLTGADPAWPTYTYLDSFPAVPPTIVGTFNLPANGATATTQILTVGDGTAILKAIARDTSNIYEGYQSAFVGVSFSNATTTNGWGLTTQSTSPNVNAAWGYDVDDLVAPRSAFGFGTAARATFNLEVSGRPVYAAVAVDARLANVSVPEKVTCYSGNQAIVALVENTGINPIAAGAAAVTLTVAGPNPYMATVTNATPIPSGSSADFLFANVVLDNPGLNIATAIVSLAADARPTNDTFITANATATTINTFPIVDDAEQLLEPVITFGETIVSDQAWIYYNDAAKFENLDFPDSLPAYSGTGLYIFDAWNALPGVESRLYTNCIQLGASANGGGSCGSSVSFWLSSDSSWLTRPDSVYVSVSTDKGNSWTRLIGFSRLNAGALTPVWNQNIVDLSNYNGQTIQIGFEGVSKFGQSIGLDDVELISNCVVPVTLASFTVQKLNKANLLTWKTSQEINSAKYVVQLSKDGRNFSDIGQVLASGNSNTEKTYTYTHNLPTRGYNYYRVKIVDRDNKFKFTDIRSVQNLGVNEISVSPNPVASNMKLAINADKADMATVVITDMSGKAIYTKSHSVIAGDNLVDINSNGFNAGTYIIKVQVNGDVQVAKFIKL